MLKQYTNKLIKVKKTEVLESILRSNKTGRRNRGEKERTSKV